VGNNSSFDPGVFEQAWKAMGIEVEDVDIRLMYGGRLIWNTPLDALLVGGSFFKYEDLIATGDMPAELTSVIPGTGGQSLYPAGTKLIMTSKETAIWHIFSRYAIDRLTLTGEGYRTITTSEMAADQDFNPAIAPPGFQGFGGERYSNHGGWYAMADYQATDWFAMAVIYGEKYTDWEDPMGSDRADDHWRGFQRDTTVSMKFNITPYWNLKIESHFMDGASGVNEGLQEDPDDVERYWNLYAAKTTFYF
jgi:hypothetical protein